MKKIVILSDTHGNRADLQKMHNILSEADLILFAGDGANDMLTLPRDILNKVIAVSGNCDLSAFEKERLVDVEEVSPHYMIIVDRVNNLDTLEVQVEINPQYFTDEIRGIEALTKKISHVLNQALGLNPKVKIVEPQTLVRSEGKAVHVIDKRKLY